MMTESEAQTRRWGWWLAIFLAAPPVVAPATGAQGASALELARQLNQAFIDVAEKVSPAVVVVRIAHKPSYVSPDDGDNPFFDLLPPDMRKRLEEQREKQRKEQEDDQKRFHRGPIWDAEGSGVVIRKEGYILTNFHVVDGAEKIKVRFRDGTEFNGEVRGVDPQSDLAVIRIEPKGRTLAIAQLGDSGKTRVGEFAIAIGAPFGFDHSVTVGHISAKGRSRIILDEKADQDYIQTDANINPGNSGGPLVNIDGEVIGINTLIHGMHSGIGFAIPSNLAREISEKLITDGKFVRAFLGIKIDSLQEVSEYRDSISGVNEGVLVKMILPDTPAKRSDLRPGDVITAVDGRPVATPQQLRNEIRGKKIGAPVTLDVHRFGKNIKVVVRPEASPDESAAVASPRSARSEDKTRLMGLTVQPVTKELAEQFGLEKIEGVCVTEVERGSAAERKGFKAGDVITDVDAKAVTTVKQFQQAMQEADPKKGAAIIFTRSGTSIVQILKDVGDE